MTEETLPFYRAATGPAETFIPRALDEDELTVTTGESPTANSHKTNEICIRWEFPTNMDKKTLMKSHLDILKAMKSAFPNMIIIDNNREEHATTKTLNLSKAGVKFEFWTSKNRTTTNQRVICQHRMRTDAPLSEVKSTWEVMEKLRKAKAYVGLHELGEKVKDVAHLGFLLKTHVVHVPKSIAIQRLRQRLKEEHGEVPRFTLVAQNITANKNNDLRNRARAYDIRCDYRDAPRLTKMLQSDTFTQDPVYMPYYMRKMNPTAFTNALRLQNEIHCNAYVIKATGISTATMDFLWQQIATEAGMMEIVPTVHHQQKGEWKILVHKDQFNQMHTKLNQLLEKWWNEQDEQTQKEYPYPEPKITSRRNSGQHDSDDESLHTYSSMLTNMYDPPSEDETCKEQNAP